MFLKSLLQNGQKAVRPQSFTMRFFSQSIKPPTGAGGFGMKNAMIMGASMAGFGYLAYNIHDMNANK